MGKVLQYFGCGFTALERAAILTALTTQTATLARIEASIGSNQGALMADVKKLQSDETDLAAAVAANTTAIATLVSSDAATIAGLNDQIATLKAANPDLDLASMEASTAQLLKNNASAAALSAPLPLA